MYEDMPAGYLITSRDMLLPLLNDASHHSINLNEMFIESDEQTTVDALASLVPNLAQSWEAEAVRKAYKANPLALGLRSVTFFGYALTVLLSLVGFATHGLADAFFLEFPSVFLIVIILTTFALRPTSSYPASNLRPDRWWLKPTIAAVLTVAGMGVAVWSDAGFAAFDRAVAASHQRAQPAEIERAVRDLGTL